MSKHNKDNRWAAGSTRKTLNLAFLRLVDSFTKRPGSGLGKTITQTIAVFTAAYAASKGVDLAVGR